MSEARPTPAGTQGVYLFLLLACAITWAMDAPFVLATLAGTTPAPVAMLLAGLGAWGPTLAALVIAARHRQLRDVFGRWRTNPIWIAAALLVIPALHLPATLIEVALGGTLAQWFYPPVRPEHVAALIMFSFGEEFGWRGFAYPRLTARHGPIVACVILGTVWAVWHVGMWTTAEGPPSAFTMLAGVIELISGSLIFAWFFERANRSMAVAIALHISAHLDNTHRAPEDEVRLQLLRLGVMVIAASFAARALARRSVRDS